MMFGQGMTGKEILDNFRKLREEEPGFWMCQYALMGDLERLKDLIDKGEDFHFKEEMPLRVACCNVTYDNLNTIDFLIKNGVDIYARKGAAIKGAFANRRKDIIDYLIDNKVPHWESIRRKAFFEGYEVSCDFCLNKREHPNTSCYKTELKPHSADVNAVDKYGVPLPDYTIFCNDNEECCKKAKIKSSEGGCVKRVRGIGKQPLY